MKIHKFTLVLTGISELDAEIANVLYEATNGEIEFSMRNGVALLEFERSASTLREAIVSAIQDVEGSADGVRVVRVESDAANTIAKINAELLGAPSI